MARRRSRRARPPRWLLLGLLLTLGVLVVQSLATSGSGSASAVAYVDRVRPEIERSTRQGADIADFRARGFELERRTIIRRLERVTKEASAVRTTVAEIDVPAELREAHTLLMATLYTRERAARRLQTAMRTALRTGDPSASVRGLADAGGFMVASDHSYEVFREAVPPARRRLLPPASKWASDPQLWAEPEVQAFVSSVRAGIVSVPVRDITLITVLTDPPAVGREEMALVLPAGDNLVRLKVVVANTGNEALEKIPVEATVASTVSEFTDVSREFVDLGVGQRTTVELNALHARPGELSSMRVVAGPVDGETMGADNEKALSFVLR